MSLEFSIFTLPNGIRVIHKHTTGDVSHCGIIINAGSRDEEEHQQGLAHFIEHVIFKGTKKRKAFHILNRIDSVGGELNAYTSKEETCIYTSFLNEFYERAIELIVDITFHSVFPQKELEKEKDVIIDEINSYQDTPSEQIFDDFEDLLFEGHPIGRNILGTVESVKSFDKKEIEKFIKKNYVTSEIVLSSVGNIDEKKLKAIATKYLGAIPANTSPRVRAPFKNYKPKTKTISRDIYQAHAVLGNIAYKSSDKRKTALTLLNNILGGPAMNSRLNLAIREKFGITYNLESNYTPYSDTGVFTIYLGTDTKTLDRCISLIHKELKKLREQKLGTMQLSQAKQQLIGQIALAQEGRVNLMVAVGKSLLLYNKVDSLEKIYKKINDVTSDEILEVANTIFTEKKLSTLIYKKN